MRIQELINTQYKSSTITPQELDDLDNTDLYAPERGAYVVGKPTNDPHVFHKQTLQATDLKNDPTFQYIKTIQPYIDSNPYFPKTYVVDVKLDQYGQARPAYDSESLVHGTHFNKRAKTQTQGEGYSGEAIYYMASKMYGNEDWIKAAPHTFAMSMQKDPRQDPIYVWAKAAALFRQLYKQYPNLEFAKRFRLNLDPDLVQSIDLIKKLEKSNPNFIEDLHPNNLMIRRTSLGPQMVINDPISTVSSYSDTES